MSETVDLGFTATDADEFEVIPLKTVVELGM
jgi:hypothetical protein